MAGYDRGTILSLGLVEPAQLDKAERHYGSRLGSMSNDEIVSWIFDGCPGYSDVPTDAMLSESTPQHQQMVPYQPGGNAGNMVPTDNSGWVQGFSEYGSDSQLTAHAMLALGHQNDGDNDVWELAPNEYSRPYSQMPPIEDTHVPQYTYIPQMVGDANNEDRGRASAPRSSPVECKTPTQATSGPAHEDDDLARALALSMEDSQSQHRSGGAHTGLGTGQSADMSRAQSQSRLEQEEADFAKALSESVVAMDRKASSSISKAKDPIDTKVRFDADTPMVMSSPSSFLAYVPAMLQTYYFNHIFRKTIIEAEIPYTPTPNFANYGTDDVQLTRTFLAPDATEAIIRIAALQRLFIYLSQSKRSRTGLRDILDAFSITAPSAMQDRNPLPAMKALHEQVCAAWQQYVFAYIRELQERGAMSEAQSAETSEHAIRLLFSQGIASPDVQDLLDLDFDPETSLTPLTQVRWTSQAEVKSISPDCNDTYSALDDHFAGVHYAAFVTKPGHSLYIFNTRLEKSTGWNDIGPAPPPYSAGPAASINDETPTPFQMAPALYLDRYDWKEKVQITQMRQEVRKAQETLQQLLSQRNRLLASAKGNKPLILAPTVGAETESQETSSSERKAILLQTVARMEELVDTVDDPARRQSQLALIEKLKAIISLMQSEVCKIQTQLLAAQEKIQKAREFGSDKIGPYDLQAVIMWNGFLGRDSSYAYVRSGSSKADLDGTSVENPKWWKVGDGSVFEVSFDAVLADKTGIYSPGGGSIVQLYTRAQEGEASQNLQASIPQAMLDALQLDNGTFLEEAKREAQTSTEAESTMPNEGVALQGEPVSASADDAGDVTMHSEEPPNADYQLTPTAGDIGPQTEEPLNLRGGASRRRSSISSETGSVASTSRVRLDDLNDDNDSETDEELVELGFPVKMSKAFKVVKDVGKVGGKPTWLDPALPLDVDMATCPSCQGRMELLVQMNCPLDDIPQAVYRTFYVYTCTKAACLKDATSQGVKVYRAQLPVGNLYYDLNDDAARARAQKFRDKQYSQFCATCKMKHEAPCASKPWKEWLIETDTEELGSDAEGDPADVEERMRAATLHGVDASSGDAREPDTRTPVDAAFLKFQERLYNEPDQVLRYYYRDNPVEPLWVSDERKSRPVSIPRCVCGTERSCEFQIMPPILSILGVNDLDEDALDFGTIIIYTCKESCSSNGPPPNTLVEGEYSDFLPPSGWQEEIGFVQNFSQQGVRFR